MNKYDQIRNELFTTPQTWLVTGVAGFIGSNLLETLLKLNQNVVGLDNFATGHRHNLDDVRDSVEESQWKLFRFLKGDIRRLTDCEEAVKDVDHVLHQAALGSVPRSIKDPSTTNEVNISGFLNMLVAACEAEVQSFTYAGSSSTYGDSISLPKEEETIGRPLSPYAVTKYVNELYAEVFFRAYGFETIGLRYFNVFGKRQDPEGAYAAVIPKWIKAMIKGESVFINGDGQTSRDFCYIDNAVQSNILAAMSPSSAKNAVYNVAAGQQTSLNKLFDLIKAALDRENYSINTQPEFRDFRAGDVRHSLANIDKAKGSLGYFPTHDLSEGLDEALPWYLSSIPVDRVVSLSSES